MCCIFGSHGGTTETFIHTLLAYKYSEQTRVSNTSYMPYWIPWSSNTLTNNQNTWLVDYIDPGPAHTQVSSSTPLKTILQFEYYNMLQFRRKNNLNDLQAICSYRKVANSFQIQGEDYVFLQGVWVNGFNEDECIKVYNTLHNKNLVTKEDLRFNKGDRFIQLRF